MSAASLTVDAVRRAEETPGPGLAPTAMWPWTAEPHGLWSLLDMLERLGRFVVFRDELEKLRRQIEKAAGGAPERPAEMVLRSRVATFCSGWERAFKAYGLTHSEFSVRNFPLEARGLTHEGALAYLGRLEVAFREDCGPRLVFVIPTDRREYLKPDLTPADFGPAITEAFPAATVEIREATICYALDRNTASVFHLMRAVEHGIRALAVALGESNPPVPLEYQVWHKLIHAIEARVPDHAIEAWPQPCRSNARAFFSETIADLNSFKDSIRNVLMHTRKGGTYDAPGALSVRNRVEAFFGRLGQREVREGSRANLLDSERFR